MLDFVACAFSCDIRPPQSTGNLNRCVSSVYSWRKLIRMRQVITSTQTNQLLELCLILWFVHAHEISDPQNQPAIGIDVCHLIIAGKSSFECGRSSYQLRPASFWSYAWFCGLCILMRCQTPTINWNCCLKSEICINCKKLQNLTTQCNRMLCGRGAQIREGAKSHEWLVHPCMISRPKWTGFSPWKMKFAYMPCKKMFRGLVVGLYIKPSMLIWMWQVIISTQTNQLLEFCLILWLVHSHEISDPHNQPATGIASWKVKFAYSANKCDVCIQCKRMFCGTSFWSYAWFCGLCILMRYQTRTINQNCFLKSETCIQCEKLQNFHTQCNRMLCGHGAQIWEGAKSHEWLVHSCRISCAFSWDISPPQSTGIASWKVWEIGIHCCKKLRNLHTQCTIECCVGMGLKFGKVPNLMNGLSILAWYYAQNGHGAKIGKVPNLLNALCILTWYHTWNHKNKKWYETKSKWNLQLLQIREKVGKLNFASGASFWEVLGT
jgi:hypothetical protein